jgi:hypothetical protein
MKKENMKTPADVHKVMGELSDELFAAVQEYIAVHNTKNFSKLTMQRIIPLALSEFIVREPKKN